MWTSLLRNENRQNLAQNHFEECGKTNERKIEFEYLCVTHPYEGGGECVRVCSKLMADVYTRPWALPARHSSVQQKRVSQIHLHFYIYLKIKFVSFKRAVPTACHIGLPALSVVITCAVKGLGTLHTRERGMKSNEKSPSSFDMRKPLHMQCMSGFVKR